jgi:hypothetical protein
MEDGGSRIEDRGSRMEDRGRRIEDGGTSYWRNEHFPFTPTSIVDSQPSILYPPSSSSLLFPRFVKNGLGGCRADASYAEGSHG